MSEIKVSSLKVIGAVTYKTAILKAEHSAIAAATLGDMCDHLSERETLTGLLGALYEAVDQGVVCITDAESGTTELDNPRREVMLDLDDYVREAFANEATQAVCNIVKSQPVVIGAHNTYKHFDDIWDGAYEFVEELIAKCVKPIYFYQVKEDGELKKVAYIK